MILILSLTEYDSDYNSSNEDQNNKQEEYYDQPQIYDDPVTTRHVESIGSLEASTSNPRFEQAPTLNSVSEFSLANAVNLRGKIFSHLKILIYLMIFMGQVWSA